jgi:hypothetical protein
MLRRGTILYEVERQAALDSFIRWGKIVAAIAGTIAVSMVLIWGGAVVLP